MEALSSTSPVAGSSNIDNLPTEVIEHVFTFLDIEHRIRAELVCKRWRAISKERTWTWPTALNLCPSHHFSALRSYDLTDDILVAVFSRCGKGLTKLAVEKYRKFTKRATGLIGKYCPNLLELKLYGMSLTAQNRKALAKGCPKLTSITLHDNLEATEGEMVEWLSSFKKLDSLSYQQFHFPVFEGDICKSLPPKVKMLHLSIFTSLNFPRVSQTLRKTCTDLQKFSLNLYDMSRRELLTSMRQPTPNELIKLFGHFKNSLKNVYLGGYQNDINWIKALTNLPNLEELSLVYCRGVNDDLLKSLDKKGVHLRSLNVADNESVTDEFMDKLPRSLKLLDVSYTNITGEGITSLAMDGNLEELYIRCCPNFKEIYLHNVANTCANFRILDASGTRKITKRVVKTFWTSITQGFIKGYVHLIVGDTSVSSYKMKTCPRMKISFYSTVMQNAILDTDDENIFSDDSDSDVSISSSCSFYDTSDSSINCPLPLFPMKKKRRLI